MGNIGHKVLSDTFKVSYIGDVPQDQQALVFPESDGTNLEADVVIDRAGNIQGAAQLVLHG